MSVSLLTVVMIHQRNEVSEADLANNCSQNFDADDIEGTNIMFDPAKLDEDTGKPRTCTTQQTADSSACCYCNFRTCEPLARTSFGAQLTHSLSSLSLFLLARR